MQMLPASLPQKEIAWFQGNTAGKSWKENTKNKKQNKTYTQEVKELGCQEAHGESYPGSSSQGLFGEGEGDEAGWMLVNFW